jgi:hypothetical protein
VWQTLAIFLPFIFCLALILRPDSSAEYHKVDKDDFSFSLKRLTNDTGRLTVELTNSLTVPSCVVYLSTQSQNLLLGKIDQIGSYHFDIPVEARVVNIQLYDPIHSREITRAELSYNNE